MNIVNVTAQKVVLSGKVLKTWTCKEDEVLKVQTASEKHYSVAVYDKDDNWRRTLGWIPRKNTFVFFDENPVV